MGWIIGIVLLLTVAICIAITVGAICHDTSENTITVTQYKTRYQEFTPYAKVEFTEKLILDKKYCDINKSFNRFYIEMNRLTKDE